MKNGVLSSDNTIRIYITVYDKENAKRSEDAVEMPPEHAS